MAADTGQATPTPKPLFWVGSSKDDLLDFPSTVRKGCGYALYLAQIGLKSPHTKPLRGFGGAGVLEVVEDFDGSSYRAVYTVRFASGIFVLHAFQKKSKKGIATPRAEIEIIKRRLKVAAELHEQLESDRSL